MKKAVLVISLAVAVLPWSANALSQNIKPLTPLEPRSVKLPRYNIWIDGNWDWAGMLSITKAPSTETRYKTREWQLSVSADFFLGKWDVLKHSRLSFYLGGQLGFRHNTYSTADPLTLSIVQMAPGYAQIGAWGSIQLSFSRERRPWIGVRAGYLFEPMVSFRIDAQSRVFTGYSRDCMTPYINTFFISPDVILDRIRVGLPLYFRHNPPLSVERLNYYKGVDHSLSWHHVLVGLSISFLLGGTDK